MIKMVMDDTGRQDTEKTVQGTEIPWSHVIA